MARCSPTLTPWQFWTIFTWYNRLASFFSEFLLIVSSPPVSPRSFNVSARIPAGSWPVNNFCGLRKVNRTANESLCLTKNAEVKRVATVDELDCRQNNSELRRSLFNEQNAMNAVQYLRFFLCVCRTTGVVNHCQFRCGIVGLDRTNS